MIVQFWGGGKLGCARPSTFTLFFANTPYSKNCCCRVATARLKPLSVSHPLTNRPSTASTSLVFRHGAHEFFTPLVLEFLGQWRIILVYLGKGPTWQPNLRGLPMGPQSKFLSGIAWFLHVYSSFHWGSCQSSLMRTCQVPSWSGSMFDHGTSKTYHSCQQFPQGKTWENTIASLCRRQKIGDEESHGKPDSSVAAGGTVPWASRCFPVAQLYLGLETPTSSGHHFPRIQRW